MNFVCQILLNEMDSIPKSLVLVRSIIILNLDKEQRYALRETEIWILFFIKFLF